MAGVSSVVRWIAVRLEGRSAYRGGREYTRGRRRMFELKNEPAINVTSGERLRVKARTDNYRVAPCAFALGG
jgi:hypothetical protein